MAAVSDTTEGSGESFLKQWLDENRLLSLEKTLLIEAQVNAEELLDLALNTEEAIQFCNDFGINNALIRKRFIKALSTFPALYSQHNTGGNDNDNNNAPKLIVATLSKEEEDIINKVNKQRKENKISNNKIDKLLQNIDNKKKVCYNQINNIFNELQKALNDRKTVLHQQLDSICTDKLNQLISSKKNIKENNDKIKQFQLKNTQLLMNWQMDKNERKQQIVRSGADIANDASFPIIVNENVGIEVKCDKDEAIQFISEIGLIGAPKCPQITIKDVGEKTVDITANCGGSGNIEKLHVDICEDNGNFDDDIKLQWIQNVYEVKDNSASYKIDNLQDGTKYGLRTKMKNNNGWSKYCDIILFETKYKPVEFTIYNNKHYVLSNNVKTIKGSGGNCWSSGIYSTKGYTTGVHKVAVKSVKVGVCGSCIGITSGERNTASTNGTHYPFHGFGGHVYYAGYPEACPWKKANDIVTVTLDCNDWKVTFCDNNGKVIKETNIERNQTYFFGMSACGIHSHFEIM